MTPWGAPNTALLIALVGALSDRPIDLSALGANSNTLEPFATHKDRLSTWGFGAVMFPLSLQAHANSANANIDILDMVKDGSTHNHQKINSSWGAHMHPGGLHDRDEARIAFQR